MAGKILVVEDDSAVRELVVHTLQRKGYEAVEAPDADAGHRRVLEEPPELIVLDWMLPGTSGIEWTRQLKDDPVTRAIPVILLTARSEEDDRVRGLDAGADDYIVKPFSPRELTARVKAVLRRAVPTAGEEPVEVEGLHLDPASHRVTSGGRTVELGPTEFRLLHFFMTHPERVYTRAQLLDHVWGTNVYIEERTVDVHIRRLRKTLAPYGQDWLIQTVRGTGYRFSNKL